jgi:thiol-disulfide isomerase/thioredoxin
MKNISIIIFLLGLTGCQQPEFYDVQGAGHQFDDFTGRYLIVNYWATWCAPCIREIPELNEFADEFHGRVAVWGVNYDAPQGAEQLRQVQKMQITFPVFAANPSERLGVAMPEVLPTTLVFDPQGTLLATLFGPQTRASLLAALALE